MSSEVLVKWPEWEEIINDRFIPLIENRDRYIILYGGRGSSKSDAMAKKFIFRCLTERYFRCMLIRNEYSTIKESSYQTLKDIIIDLGLASLFEFKVSPLEIICLANGNRFIARGCDDTTKLKSVKDISAAWYEEDIISESDFITITTSIRTTKAEYLQEVFTINPEVEGDFRENWLFKRFFDGHDEQSFSSTSEVEIAKGVAVNMNYTVHHSMYSDNKWIPPEFIAFLQDMKKRNPYYYQVYCLGLWGNKVLGGAFFKLFEVGKNTAAVTYNPALPLWVSMDFNTAPGVSCGIFQIENKVLTMIDEIQLRTPRNTTIDVCREICRRYNDHRAGMFVTGDSSGKSDSTRTEKGFNDYTIILAALKQFRPSDKVPKLNPRIVPSAGFINSIFLSGKEKYKGCEIIIGEHCKKMIADLLYQVESSEGLGEKKRVTDPTTGGTYEQYGHFNDLFRYVCCVVFVNEFSSFERPSGDCKIITGKNLSPNNNWGQNNDVSRNPTSRNMY